ncbi:general secretion pathway protein G [Desulfosarcina sp. BuS5]|nr:general secretion pathway protein G [Desulfosarcina sp. BuS5]
MVQGLVKMPTMMNRKGYTLIELVIVMAIIAILATIAQPNYERSRIKAKETSLQRSLFIFRDVIDQFYADHGLYPENLNELCDKKYIRAVPKDPFTGSADTWIIIPPEDAEEEGGGIYDVHSGSDKVSLSGVPYNEW